MELLVCLVLSLFFFSSRRRHTRFDCDWSSDVCSSDLNPYDNAQAESFIKTLKYEEVYRTEYLDFADARRGIGKFIDSVYNEKRLHSALGYLPPAEFEQQQLLLQAGCVMGQA